MRPVQNSYPDAAHSEPSNYLSLFKKYLQYQWVIPVLVFVSAVMIIGVAHETPFDEDFCYAWTVRHLLDTGEYRLHDWAAPNIRFQAYWGAIFVKINTGLYSGLRLSTVTLCGLALVAFYRLALFSNLTNKSAVIATVSLITCPFFLAYSVCFVSDGPFLALALISLSFYAYSWGKHSFKVICIASIVACAAILTRQTGVAIVGTIFAAWLFDRNSKKKIWLAFCGIILPIFSLIWSATDPAAAHNLGSSITKVLQSEYFCNPVNVLSQQVWKLSMIVTYVSILILPLSIAVSISVVIRLMRLRSRLFSSTSGKRWIYCICISSVFLIIGFAYHKLSLQKSLVPPYLPWYWEWLYGGIFDRFHLLKKLLFPVVLVISSLTGAVILQESRRLYFGWRRLKFNWLFWFSAFGLGQLLIFYKLGDKYVLLMIPFAILIFVRWSRPLVNCYWKSFLCACLFIIFIQALYLGSVLRIGSAQWKEAERLRESGVPVAVIGSDWQWIAYHRYNEFAEVEWKRGDLGNTQSRFFSEWLPAQNHQALYRVIVDNRENYLPPDGWQIVKRIDVFSTQIKQVVFLPLAFEPLAVFTLKKLTPV